MTREDLSEGQRAVQSSHAAINFIFEHKSRGDPWFYSSNTLVQLEVKNEKQLNLLIEKCCYHQLTHTVFREPDLDGAITAVAIEPSERTQKLVHRIPLLFKNKINKNDKDNGYQSQDSKYNQEENVRPEQERVR